MAGKALSTSAGGVLALLEEDDDALKLHALQQLDRTAHDFWFQISSSIGAIEALYEDEDFSHRGLAALVASKVRALAFRPPEWSRLAIGARKTSGGAAGSRPAARRSHPPSGGSPLHAGLLPPGRPGRCPDLCPWCRRAV